MTVSESEIVLTANQGAPGAQRWLVDIGSNVNVTANVTGVQQRDASLDISDAAHDLQAAAYSKSVYYASDTELNRMLLTFTTAEAKTITISTDDGSVSWTFTNVTALEKKIDFEAESIIGGATLTVTITQTGAPCVASVYLTTVVQNNLGNNPVLGEGFAHIGQVGIDVADSAVVDAFGRLRTSLPRALFDTVHEYGIAPEWGSISANGGSITHDPNRSAAVLNTTTTAGSFIAFQTRQYVRYQAGMSHLILASMEFGPPVANLRRRVGYFDAGNGVYFEENGIVDKAFVLRTDTSGVADDSRRVSQANWNLDTLDGSGDVNNPSGINLDLVYGTLAVYDLQWLSVGRIRVGFDINGLLIYTHEFRNANYIHAPYMRTPHLPVRYEQENLGGAVAATSLSICSVVISEGGSASFGRLRSADRQAQSKSVGVGPALTPVFAIRPKSTFGAAARTNRGLIRPLNGVLLSSSDMHWHLIYQPTLTGASWADVDTNNSIVEHDITATAYSGGVVLDSGYQPSGSSALSLSVDLERTVLCLGPSGEQDGILLLACLSLSGNATAYASLGWREEW